MDRSPGIVVGDELADNIRSFGFHLRAVNVAQRTHELTAQVGRRSRVSRPVSTAVEPRTVSAPTSHSMGMLPR